MSGLLSSSSSSSPPPAPFRSGYAAILGKPNAGKSTLLNALLGAKVAAVSPLPQTTRTKLAGIHTDDKRQIVFLDLPGAVPPNDTLNTALGENLLDGLAGADVVVHLIDAWDKDPVPKEVAAALAAVKKPTILAINKLDGPKRDTAAEDACRAWEPPFQRARYTAVVGLSALHAQGLAPLLDAIHPLLPVGPPLFEEDQLVDAPMRELAAEMIREKVFYRLREEVPYSVAVEIEEFVERPAPQKWYIRATLHVERESQKSILIGSGGSVLKDISARARTDIEALCGNPVFLELWVKVRKNWRGNEQDLKRFGVKRKKR